MAFTVSDALAKLKGARVIGGHSGLQRIIEHVTVVDAPQAVDWLRGGELVLTTAYTIREGPEAQLEFVKRVAESGAAALGIKLRRFIDALSDDVIGFADSVGLPIIDIPLEVAWVDIITPVLTEVVERQANVLQRSMDIHTKFIDVILSGGGMSDIAAVLASQIGTAVSVVDMKWGLEAAAGRPGDCLEGLPESWEDEILLLRSAAEPIGVGDDWEPSSNMSRVRVMSPDVAEHCAVIADAGVNGDQWGRVLVIEPAGRPLSKMDAIAVGHAVTAATLESLRAKTAANVERRFKFNFWDDLIHRRFDSADALTERAKSFSLDLTIPHLLLAVAVDPPPTGLEDDYGDGVGLQDQILQVVETFGSQAWGATLVGFAYRQGAAILVPRKGADEPMEAKKEGVALAEKLRRRLNTEIAPRTVSVGVGHYYSDPLAVARSYQEAYESVTLARTIHGPNRVVHFDDLGAYRVLSKCTNRRELSAFVADQLGLIEHYDAKRGSALLTSLECFLDCGGSMQTAADKMYVHVNTMKYRMQRVEKLAGIDLSNQEARFNLQLALRIRQYIKATYEL